jgi:hypothetical protein
MHVPGVHEYSIASIQILYKSLPPKRASAASTAPQWHVIQCGAPKQRNAQLLCKPPSDNT